MAVLGGARVAVLGVARVASRQSGGIYWEV